MLLAIDTSTQVCSIALYDEHGVVSEVTWRTRENHTRSLMPQIVRMMEWSGASVNELRALGVATGPGSFTGLRIGLSAAKGLAFSLNCPLLGVPTLDVTANMYAVQPLPVYALLQVGRGRYGAAYYEIQDGRAVRARDYFFGDADALAAHLNHALEKEKSFAVAGEIDDALRHVFAAHGAKFFLACHDGLNGRRAGVLAALAWQRWQSGDVDDLQTLTPYYIPTASLA